MKQVEELMTEEPAAPGDGVQNDLAATTGRGGQAPARTDTDEGTTLQTETDNLPARPQIRIERSHEHFAHLHTAIEYLATPAAIRTHELMDRSLFEGQKSVVIGVTSAIAGEGKTTIALHLAMSIARNSFKKVCLMDLSLSRNTLSQRLGIPETQGLVDVLEGDHHTVTTIESDECKGFFFVPSGKDAENPNRIARSPILEEVMAASRELYDVIIIELPSVASGNVLPIKPHVDALLMVVWAGVTPREVVNTALDKLGKDKMMGVVLNRTQDHVPNWMRRWLKI